MHQTGNLGVQWTRCRSDRVKHNTLGEAAFGGLEHFVAAEE